MVLKYAVFGLSSSLPPLVDGGGGPMCESVGKSDLLSDHFDRNACLPALPETGIVLLGVTFDSKMTFEKHLSFSIVQTRAAYQRLGLLRKSWQAFHDRLPLGRCFLGFVLPVLEYCSAPWCSAADTHPKLQDRVVSDSSFLTMGVFVCWSAAH